MGNRSYSAGEGACAHLHLTLRPIPLCPPLVKGDSDQRRVASPLCTPLAELVGAVPLWLP